MNSLHGYIVPRKLSVPDKFRKSRCQCNLVASLYLLRTETKLSDIMRVTSKCAFSPTSQPGAPLIGLRSVQLSDVPGQMAFLREGPAAGRALVRLFSGVCSAVPAHVVFPHQLKPAHGALVELLSSEGADMGLQQVRSPERLLTGAALVWLAIQDVPLE